MELSKNELSRYTIPIDFKDVNKEGMLNLLNNNGFSKLVDFLNSTDFFTAPASRYYHDAFKGGLYLHSVRLFYFLNRLMKEFQITNVLPSIRHNPAIEEEDKVTLTALVIGLSHDLCKTDFYETSYRNTKDENGNWIKVPYFSIKKNTYKIGHAVESIRVLRKLLTPEDLDFVEPAILFHMGAYDLAEYQKTAITEWTCKDPLVLLTQTADQMAAYWFHDQEKPDFWN